MTRNDLLELIDRLDGYGLTITDYDLLNERVDAEADHFDPLDCHTGDCLRSHE
jgi:hypothetical protein